MCQTVASIVGMATRLVQINMKARDDSALGGFWAAALGWTVSSEGPGVTNLEPEGFVYPDPVAVCLVVRLGFDLVEGGAAALNLGDDVFRGGFPDERLGVFVPVLRPCGDGRGQLVNAGEHAAA
jgi:hypothetical protein